ncbi:MAG TPA: glycosyltransferase [Gammaproteobacteria bacterium]
MADVSVLIPTCNRPAALAVTLSSLCFQEYGGFDVVISDQSERDCRDDNAPLLTAMRLLETRGVNVAVARNLPRLGMAQQRQFLLDRARAPYSLFLDDDLLLEPYVIGMLRDVLQRERCGFAGNAVVGLSYRDDIRPEEQAIECWEGPILPEAVIPGDPEWQRHRLHNAANTWHVQQRLQASPDSPVLYKVAWVGGCVMYDTGRLREAGGFHFWKELPRAHCGEDVLAQLRVAARFGGCGVLPSGAYHQELETTVPDRRVNAPEYLRV